MPTQSRGHGTRRYLEYAFVRKADKEGKGFTLIWRGSGKPFEQLEPLLSVEDEPLALKAIVLSDDTTWGHGVLLIWVDGAGKLWAAPPTGGSLNVPANGAAAIKQTDVLVARKPDMYADVRIVLAGKDGKEVRTVYLRQTDKLAPIDATAFQKTKEAVQAEKQE